MEQEKILHSAQSLQTLFDTTSSSLRLTRNATDLNSHKLTGDGDAPESEEQETKDPAVLAMEVSSQVSYLRKLKFQYLEQNAKDKYVKSIVSDIDDAPLFTDDDNKQLATVNQQKKERLKMAKNQLHEVHSNIRTLAPLVEQDYVKIQQATTRATELAQKIIDARLALSRLRQTHPHPRLTVEAADETLARQVEEMQQLTDKIQDVSDKVRVVKQQVKSGALEVEGLKSQRAEVEKNAKQVRVEEDDGRLVPLYDWLTASLAFHRSMQDLEEMNSVSDNELRLKYRIEDNRGYSHFIVITLIFVPDTRQLASVDVHGVQEIGVDLGDVIDAHIETNNVRGLLSAILARAREEI
ncbi:hypothetical protein K435DRAFT_816281 [Dendrothele bispora CBS 962.96]|uniref:Kinetochore protein Sos7 coiled-coil domain-containing protein n=1 Tax=Dendrothele bispora (strain CBS 962.96) TaxID=1314807 RepID=A0A4S8MRG8_DENBC|nr:hypothetical protein K435DRAFT_816281 [Dendrothele bispora CBS 962.96]